MVTALEPVHFPWYDYRSYTFSLGLSLDGRAAILSGHTASAFDPERGKADVKGTLEEQVRTAYAKIEAILAADGFGLADVRRVVEYVKVDTLDEYAAIDRARREVLGATDPVVNTVCVRQLLRTKALLEVEVTARKDDGGVLGDVVYLPSITAPGDGMREQAAAAFDEVERRLGEYGLGLERVTKIVEYPRADALDAIRDLDAVRRERFAGWAPASTRIPVDRNRGSALVQLDVMASLSPARVVGAPGEAVAASRILFLSGQGGLDEYGNPLRPGDVVGQAEDALTATERILASEGIGLNALIKTVEYSAVEALPAYRGVAGVRARLLTTPYPASTGLVVPRLAAEGQHIEIDSLALLPT